ncbi:hypothetical protein [Blastococcus sp. PRF04-17]|uniref:hypothetical protein n=1 Tax=Blastococcus sp. PRF04-17 TaxID=2933797 RepID=UPI001FF19265|nr:hypothetical protein [Blastococcus sp. PRF04-17]UOY01837.1 hypothetical protein MVA48_00150 [Blastococcus sp. PRF04-17]
MLLPPLETPASVAQTFLEARYAEDWPAAWAVSCRLAREAHGSYAAFTERLTELNEYSMTPSDVEVEISDAYGIDQPGAQGVSIRYTAKPSGGNHEPWSDWGETLVVLEDGEFRVCIADR